MSSLTAPALAERRHGTVLYARGIFIKRCYDELNLSDPGLILSSTRSICCRRGDLETNTFGANRMRLARHGLADKLTEINAAGVRLARQAVARLKEKQDSEAWVAGSVGRSGCVWSRSERPAWMKQIRLCRADSHPCGRRSQRRPQRRPNAVSTPDYRNDARAQRSSRGS